ncbi:hypothetical protein ABB37_05297 [Leptomonas pyrrhocoris]|uniref:protein-tyrosine-phosphatase n=1 Tax=Leptomonas pyrrhocoris TaxID=157538 RepID=A0A0N0DUU7_LEPPY|nr:hypothetical protein ABB37_05297 [Leptomonas pyrrhocoris]KPA79462.1 hypothetical protein ABB37_05297 [Leptomonas pyrrhocoris]|eukprot:XP_015657901.1 hypothetical protein ABB37_05297 [Leptomonas pyrrhocoris]
MKVIPPNFGHVEEGIFRCGAPEPRHYGFLASLGLRTCILLTDTHDGMFVHWLQETGVMIFCPLSSEAQTRSSVRDGPHVYSTVSTSENMSFPQPLRSSGGGGVREGATTSGSAAATNAGGGGSSNGALHHHNSRDDGLEEFASPNGGAGDGLNPSGGSGGRLGPVEGSYLLKEGEEGADGGEGGVDGSGNYNSDGALNTTNHNHTSSSNNNNLNLNAAATTSGGSGGGVGVSANRGGWGSQRTTTRSSTGAAIAGTSNAVRFLQENVVERQVSTKFSPVLVQEPMHFPDGVRNNGGGGGGGNAGGGGGLYQFVSAPSYEGRLHGLMTLSEAVVVSILHILLDPQYYPLLITCSKGRYRSGIVCGCLRKLQGWNLVSILEEYRRFAGNKSRADNEEFIELFDEELVNLELPDGRRPTILYNV